MSCGRGHGRAGWGAATDIAAIVIAHMLIGMIVDAASTHDCHAVVAQGAVFASGGLAHVQLYGIFILSLRYVARTAATAAAAVAIACHVMSCRLVLYVHVCEGHVPCASQDRGLA